MNQTFEQKLNAWAEQVAEICHEIATSTDEGKRLDKAFYVFQSEPPRNEGIDLLIIGLNPGNDFSLEAQYVNPIWGIKNNKMDKSTLLQKNPCFDNCDSWKIWKNLEKSFSKQVLANACYINQVYFNTGNYKALQNQASGPNAIKVCRELTQEFIRIVQPKNILCLGVSDCFSGMGIGAFKVIKTNKANKKLVIKKVCDGIPVYGIPHPSGARGISDYDRKEIGEILNANF